MAVIIAEKEKKEVASARSLAELALVRYEPFLPELTYHEISDQGRGEIRYTLYFTGYTVDVILYKDMCDAGNYLASEITVKNKCQNNYPNTWGMKVIMQSWPEPAE